MTREEQLFNDICERCESFAIGMDCEDKKQCPAYQLYCIAKKKQTTTKSSWEDTTPRNSECNAVSAPTGWI